MGQMSRIIGGVAMTLFVIGVIANLKDLRRYVRISTM